MQHSRKCLIKEPKQKARYPKSKTLTQVPFYLLVEEK